MRPAGTTRGVLVAHVKVYGYARALAPRRAAMSEVIHACLTEVLGLPPDKRFHRFFPLADEDFCAPESRGDDYTILEILMFEGRTATTKRALYQRLYRRFEEELRIAPQDLEIIVIQTPRHDWGIRGKAGDELSLEYRVET